MSTALADAFLMVIVLLPVSAGLVTLRDWPGRPGLPVAAGVVAALGMVVVTTFVPVDIALRITPGRSLLMTPIAQLSIQLLSLAALGLVLAFGPGTAGRSWLTVTWFSVAGITFAVLLSSLPVGLLVLVASVLLWAVGLPEAEREGSAGIVVRYAAMVSLAMPLLLGAMRIAEERLTSPAGTLAVERLVLALALPGFGLVLGLVPLHAWTLTLATGAPRPLLFGTVAIGQTAAFGLFLATMARYPWITRGEYGTIIALGGALTAAVGGWLAASSDPEDPDDWIAYAVVANAGIIVAGLASGSEAAGTGAALLLLSRVLALVLLAMSPAEASLERQVAQGAAGFTLAGTPAFAGFPGLWLVLTGARAVGGPVSVLIAAGSVFLFATAVRQAFGPAPAQSQTAPQGDRGATPPGRRRAVFLLAALLVILGLVPQLVSSAVTDPLRDIYFPYQ